MSVFNDNEKENIWKSIWIEMVLLNLADDFYIKLKKENIEAVVDFPVSYTHLTLPTNREV